jgi:hypothetical protein
MVVNAGMMRFGFSSVSYGAEGLLRVHVRDWRQELPMIVGFSSSARGE